MIETLDLSGVKEEDEAYRVGLRALSTLAGRPGTSTFIELPPPFPGARRGRLIMHGDNQQQLPKRERVKRDPVIATDDMFDGDNLLTFMR